MFKFWMCCLFMPCDSTLHCFYCGSTSMRNEAPATPYTWKNTRLCMMGLSYFCVLLSFLRSYSHNIFFFHSRSPSPLTEKTNQWWKVWMWSLIDVERRWFTLPTLVNLITLYHCIFTPTLVIKLYTLWKNNAEMIYSTPLICTHIHNFF